MLSATVQYEVHEACLKRWYTQIWCLSSLLHSRTVVKTYIIHYKEHLTQQMWQHNCHNIILTLCNQLLLCQSIVTLVLTLVVVSSISYTSLCSAEQLWTFLSQFKIRIPATFGPKLFIWKEGTLCIKCKCWQNYFKWDSWEKKQARMDREGFPWDSWHSSLWFVLPWGCSCPLTSWRANH